ncbi:hypothetical protein PANDA_019719 [Ailuropoda melanoleuca]|uniref:Rab-GAP TBC domain-containing protein n=1 Tax=Ailuropoda melanoleuca TaxID=9646 RepID=D2I2S3_AILME|nr:hypothetical protein PANDA_019719 [Ailuropoda melanoleuca]
MRPEDQMEPPEGTGRTTKTQTTQARNQLSAETPSMPREAGRRQVRTRGSALGRSDVTVTRRPPAALRSPVSLQERASIPGSMAAEAPGACPHVTRPRVVVLARPPRVSLAGVPGTCGPGGDINVMGLGVRFGFFQQGLGMHILPNGPLRSADCLVELDSIRDRTDTKHCSFSDDPGTGNAARKPHRQLEVLALCPWLCHTRTDSLAPRSPCRQQVQLPQRQATGRCGACGLRVGCAGLRAVAENPRDPTVCVQSFHSSVVSGCPPAAPVLASWARSQRAPPQTGNSKPLLLSRHHSSGSAQSWRSGWELVHTLAGKVVHVDDVQFMASSLMSRELVGSERHIRSPQARRNTHWPAVPASLALPAPGWGTPHRASGQRFPGASRTPVCSCTMEEDLDTLLALERANIIANYTQGEGAARPQPPRGKGTSLSWGSGRTRWHHRQETRRADKWVKMLRKWDRYRHSEKVGRRVPTDGTVSRLGMGCSPQPPPNPPTPRPHERPLPGERLLPEPKPPQAQGGQQRERQGRATVPSSCGSRGPALGRPSLSADTTEPSPEASRCLVLLGLRSAARACLTSAAFFPVDARRVYKGVPPQVRGQLWALLLDIETVKATNQGVYKGCRARAPTRASRHENEEAGPALLQGHRQIDLDVNRTFRNHVMFWDHYGIRQRALFHVLSAYSIYNTDEEQMGTGIYTAKWFLQCFIDRNPFSLTLKLWDAYILDGERVLTAMAYTVLKVHSTGGTCHQRPGLEQSPGSIRAEAEAMQTCGDPVREPQHCGCSSGNVLTPRVSTGCQVGDASTHASV